MERRVWESRVRIGEQCRGERNFSQTGLVVAWRIQKDPKQFPPDSPIIKDPDAGPYDAFPVTEQIVGNADPGSKILVVWQIEAATQITRSVHRTQKTAAGNLLQDVLSEPG